MNTNPTPDRAPTKRSADQQIAFDTGYGHRAISHDRSNPYRTGDDLHGHWENGFEKADHDANAWADSQDKCNV